MFLLFLRPFQLDLFYLLTSKFHRCSRVRRGLDSCSVEGKFNLIYEERVTGITFVNMTINKLVREIM